MSSKKCSYCGKPVDIFDNSRGFVNFYPSTMGRMESYHEYCFVRKCVESDLGRKISTEEME